MKEKFLFFHSGEILLYRVAYIYYLIFILIFPA